MEENKMKEMTQEEREKYEQRKKAWLEKRRQKEEKHRREMEEKLHKNRERMASEYLLVNLSFIHSLIIGEFVILKKK